MVDYHEKLVGGECQGREGQRKLVVGRSYKDFYLMSKESDNTLKCRFLKGDFIANY